MHNAFSVTAQIANALAAALNCDTMTGRDAMAQAHRDHINRLNKEHMPSGSGFDAGTEFDWDASTPEKLVFNTSYHHMVDGSYDGWTEHTVTVTPSFVTGKTIEISGEDRDGILDYVADVFGNALDEIVSSASNEEYLADRKAAMEPAA